MISTVTLKITENDLKRYTIVFNKESNQEFVKSYSYPLTQKKTDELLGYDRGLSNGMCAHVHIKKGSYPAPRIKDMCKNSNGKIKPSEIRLKYGPTVELDHQRVDKSTENAVWESIGDEL